MAQRSIVKSSLGLTEMLASRGLCARGSIVSREGYAVPHMIKHITAGARMLGAVIDLNVFITFFLPAPLRFRPACTTLYESSSKFAGILVRLFPPVLLLNSLYHKCVLKSIGCGVENEIGCFFGHAVVFLMDIIGRMWKLFCPFKVGSLRC